MNKCRMKNFNIKYTEIAKDLFFDYFIYKFIIIIIIIFNYLDIQSIW